MDPYSMMILLSIGNVVGWLAGIYVKNALPGLIGHIVVSTIGAFIAAYLFQWVFSEADKFGMIISAFIGAALLLYVLRLRKLRS